MKISHRHGRRCAIVCSLILLPTVVRADLLLKNARPAVNASWVQSVSVFGDGLAKNGPEDDRVVYASKRWRELGLDDWASATGTIHCEGRLRGSATIINTQGFGTSPPGLVLSTAAHVLYDLDSKTPFSSCAFHYLGLDSLPGYQGQIDLSSAMLGMFSPHDSTEDDTFGEGDWALLHVPSGIPAAVSVDGIKLKPFAQFTENGASENTQVGLLAWSDTHDALAFSLNCTATPSSPGDIGGGRWEGQILDNCDSGQGASGGGLISMQAGQPFLVGMRTGTHWQGREFPEGPAEGAQWDVLTHTNFCRAIDEHVMDRLRQFLARLGRTEI